MSPSPGFSPQSQPHTPYDYIQTSPGSHRTPAFPVPHTHFQHHVPATPARVPIDVYLYHPTTYPHDSPLPFSPERFSLEPRRDPKSIGAYHGPSGDKDGGGEEDTTSRVNFGRRHEEDDELAGIDTEIANALPGPEKRSNEEYYLSTHHQAQFAQLRRNGYNSEIGYTLNSLADGEPGWRPRYKYETIMKCAILGSPRQRLTLNEIYQAMEMRFSYFRDTKNKQSWRNSVRFLLSYKSQFVQEVRPEIEPGRGNYWTVNPNETGNKRDRKRSKKSSQGVLFRSDREAAKRQPEVQRAYNAERSSSCGTPMGMSTSKSYPLATIPTMAGSYASISGLTPHSVETPVPLNLHRSWDGAQARMSSLLYTPYESGSSGRRTYRREEVECRQPYSLPSGSRHRP